MSVEVSAMSVAIGRDEIEVKLRRMKFAIDGTAPALRGGTPATPEVPKYWARGSKFLTHWFNAMSVVFPEGEKFFIEAVRRFEPAISDPKLREQVRGFVAQEGHHTFQHRVLNDMVARQGVDMARQERFIAAFLRWLRTQLTPEEQLAVTCALEHYTAIWGHELLATPECMAGFDPRVTPLWRWHAAEETEHKAVCFDVFQSAVGSYYLRAKGQVDSTLLFIPILHLIQLRLMRDDPEPTRIRDVLAGLSWIWGKPGFFRRALQRHWLEYFKPGFHPWQHDNSELIARWKQSDEPLYKLDR
jgi:predicted metal-dependent hydrolase